MNNPIEKLVDQIETVQELTVQANTLQSLLNKKLNELKAERDDLSLLHFKLKGESKEVYVRILEAANTNPKQLRELCGE